VLITRGIVLILGAVGFQDGARLGGDGCMSWCAPSWVVVEVRSGDPIAQREESVEGLP
jgi:hypothetical protein